MAAPALPSLDQLEAAAAVVRSVVPPTPQYCWPLLSRRIGAELWVKHENHTPVGAFKLRGGLVYLDALRRENPGVAGVITATTGNHGQSIAYAATRLGLAATIVVPYGNSPEKNRAMRAFRRQPRRAWARFPGGLRICGGARQGRQSAHAALVRSAAGARGRELRSRTVCGVGRARLDTVYVPIGLGSGICGVIAAREALGQTAEIVGVVAENAPTYALSFAAGRAVPTNSADTMAGGLAVRVPDDEALAIIRNSAARIVTVSEAEMRSAMRAIFTDTHNVAEGAGAAAFAAVFKERDRLAGKRVAIVLSGGNIDRALFAAILAEPDSETE